MKTIVILFAITGMLAVAGCSNSSDTGNSTSAPSAQPATPDTNTPPSMPPATTNAP